MKVAILYICTGIYSQFWDGFYESCKKYFLNDCAELHFFVFTDKTDLIDANDVTIVYKEFEGFPKDSLFRFKTFLRVESELEKYDYIFFFNSNTRFVDYVGVEILPSDGLCGFRWPGTLRFDKLPFMFDYERNRKSTAYIPPFKGPYRYYVGAANGGTSSAFLKMVRTLKDNIEADLDEGIVAIYHDESHLNRYMYDNPPKTLSSDYLWPETDIIPPSVKIVIIDKTKFSDYFNKGRKKGVKGAFYKVYHKIVHAVRWYLP